MCVVSLVNLRRQKPVDFHSTFNHAPAAFKQNAATLPALHIEFTAQHLAPLVLNCFTRQNWTLFLREFILLSSMPTVRHLPLHISQSAIALQTSFLQVINSNLITDPEKRVHDRCIHYTCKQLALF
jgi:hypothetical protein